MKLIKLRKQYNISQRDLAFKLNCFQSTISNYETGKRTPNLQTMQKIADALNVDLQIIVDCFLSKESKNEIQNIKGVRK